MISMNRLVTCFIIFIVFFHSYFIGSQNSFVLDVNGLTNRQKIELYMSHADKFDIQSEIIFLVYVTYRSSELLLQLDNKDISDIDKQHLEASIAYQWGRIYYFIQNYSTAEESLLDTINLSKNTALTNNARALLVKVYKEKIEFEQALAITEQLLSSDINSFQRYNVLLEQSYLYLEMGQLETAKLLALEAYDFAEKFLLPPAYQALMHLGLIEKTVKNFNEAKNWWIKAYDLSLQQVNNRFAAESLYSIAQLHIELDQWEEGYYFATQALLYLAGEERNMLLADTHHLLAQYYLYKDEVDRAFVSIDLSNQVRLRVLEQSNLATQLGLNVLLMKNSNDYAIKKAQEQSKLQHMVNLIQLILIAFLIVFIFILLRRVWNAQSQQRVITLAYQALIRRISRLKGGLKVQVADMIGRNYSFGLILVRVENKHNIKQRPEGSVVLELALDNLRHYLKQRLVKLEDVEDIHITTLNYLLFFYFEGQEQDEMNFNQDIVTLPSEHQFVWYKKSIKMKLSYESYFYDYRNANGKNDLYTWINKTLNSLDNLNH